MVEPNNIDARLTVVEHYLARVIAAQLSAHDDALAQLEAEDETWQEQLAGSEAAIRVRFATQVQRPPRAQIELELAALLGSLDQVHTAFLGQVRQLLAN